MYCIFCSVLRFTMTFLWMINLPTLKKTVLCMLVILSSKEIPLVNTQSFNLWVALLPLAYISNSCFTASFQPSENTQKTETWAIGEIKNKVDKHNCSTLGYVCHGILSCHSTLALVFFLLFCVQFLWRIKFIKNKPEKKSLERILE